MRSSISGWPCGGSGKKDRLREASGCGSSSPELTPERVVVVERSAGERLAPALAAFAEVVEDGG